MLGKKNPPIVDTNFLFLIIALLLISLGSWVQGKQIYLGLLVTEYLLILFPILLYLKAKGFHIKEFLKIRRLSLKQIVYIVLIVIFSYPIAVFFNYIGILILSRYGKIIPNPVPLPSDLVDLLVGFVTIALTPGICEEVMFRGMIMKSYEVYGTRKAIILSSILFGLFHFNLQNLLGPIFLGILFGILATKTKSLLSSIVGHTANNTIALIIGFFTRNSQQNTADLIPDPGSLAYGAVALGVISFLLWLIVKKLLKSIPAGADELDMAEEQALSITGVRNRMSFIEIVPIVIIMVIFSIMNYRIFFA